MQTQIIYEDNDIIVCNKPAGVAVQTAGIASQDMVSELKNYLAGNGNKKPYVGVVHRLDQPVSGVLVFAKNQKTAASLSAQVQNGTMEKIYQTLVYGTFSEDVKAGVLEHLLYKDNKYNISRLVTKESREAGLAKKAKLSYKVLEEYTEEAGSYSKVEVKLYTGRHHQIRVQMAGSGHPILGDTKYGNNDVEALNKKMATKGLKLCACRLAFKHPKTGKIMHFEVPIMPW